MCFPVKRCNRGFAVAGRGRLAPINRETARGAAGCGHVDDEALF